MATDAKNLKICHIPVAKDDAFMASTPALGSLYFRQKVKELRIGDGQTAGGLAIDLHSAIAEGYLPISGGTMTGNIGLPNGGFIGRNADGTYPHELKIAANSDGAGAQISLYDKDSPDNGNGFIVRASDSSATYDLVGKPDGSLKWSGDEFRLRDDVVRILADDDEFAVLASQGWRKAGSALFLHKYVGSSVGDGAFALATCDGTKNKTLSGKADGSLNWDGYPLCSISKTRLSASISSSSTSCQIYWTVPSGYSSIAFNPSTVGFTGGAYIENYGDGWANVWVSHQGSGTVFIDVLFYRSFT